MICSSQNKSPNILTGLALSVLVVSGIFLVCVGALPESKQLQLGEEDTAQLFSSPDQRAVSRKVDPDNDQNNYLLQSPHSISPRNADSDNPFGGSSRTYTRPIGGNYAPASTTNPGPSPPAPAQGNVQIKILPLPIPVGLPLPFQFNSDHQHANSYGYNAPTGGGPYGYGLFSGFGSQVLGPLLKKVALGQAPNSHDKVLVSLLHHPSDQAATSYSKLPHPSPLYGNDPIRASILASRSNPLIHLLAAPYLKNIKENNGQDLPTLDDLQTLLEKSSFGLSDIDEDLGVVRN